MYIARGNYLFRRGSENYLLKRGVLASDVPSWVKEEPFFKALCRDGKIAISSSSKDIAVEKAVEEAEIKEAVVKEQKKARKAKTEE